MPDETDTVSKNLHAMLESGETASLAEIATCLEEQAAKVMTWNMTSMQDRLAVVAALVQAAGTYHVAVAQEQTAYLLQRLLDAAERDK